MMPLRKALFWVHFAIGVTVAAVAFVMAATGVLLTYERQILEWHDTHAYRAAPPAGQATHLPPATIAAVVRDRYAPAQVSAITIRRDATAPAEVGVGRTTVFVNPYTAYVWGEATEGPRPFFRAVTAWHRALGAPGRDGTFRHAIAAAANFALLFTAITGLFLWLPRTWSRRAVRNVAWFRAKLPPRARDFNWHHVVGVWCALPLFVIVLGGVVMSYPWAGNLLFRIVGEAPEPPRGGGPPGARPAGRRDGAAPRPIDAGAINDRWLAAERQAPGWQSIALRVPASAEAPLEFTIEEGTSGQPQFRSTLVLDARTGATRSLARFSDRSAGGRLRTYLRFSHTGEAGGFAGQTVAGVASLGACLLIWTGISLAWRRVTTLGLEPDTTAVNAG